MDIWGLGCVFFEILTLIPLFPGDDEIDEVNKINYILGSPSEELFEKFIKNSAHRNEFNFEFQKGIGLQRYLTHVSPNIVDLISKMLIYDPDKRPTAKQCLNHECFKELIELEIKMNNNMNNNNKVSQVNLYQNSLLMKSFNDSNSYLKVDDILLQNKNNKNNQQNNNNSHSKTTKQKKEGNISNLSLIGNGITKNQNVNNKYNYNKLLPSILLNHINEDSKGEDSFNNSSISKNHQDSYLRLPKISENKIFLRNIANLNLMNSNEFKKLKHNISNHSIENGITSLFTQYEKKQVLNIRKKINEVKKKYVSPYSKKTIENNLLI
jgi:serine/threonine protein kinase